MVRRILVTCLDEIHSATRSGFLIHLPLKHQYTKTCGSPLVQPTESDQKRHMERSGFATFLLNTPLEVPPKVLFLIISTNLHFKMPLWGKQNEHLECTYFYKYIHIHLLSNKAIYIDVSSNAGTPKTPQNDNF